VLSTDEPDVRLDEFDKDEWWDIVQEIRPDLTRAEYEEMWDDFIKMKARKRVN
jgi:hypothetical protein